MEYDDEATKEAAWQLMVSEAKIWKEQRIVALPEVKAAFFAGWEACRDAMAQAAEIVEELDRTR